MRNPKNDLHSPEMERALVACALADGGVYDVTGIQPGDFYLPLHARVWRAIGELRTAGEYVDFVTVLHALDAAQSGVTQSELAHIQAYDANLVHYETYARSVLEYAHRRRILALAEQTARIALNSNGSYADDLAALRDRFAAAVQQLRTDQTSTSDRFQVFTAADALAPQPGVVWAIDKLLMPGSVNVLFGVPGSGKTYTACDMGVCFALGLPWAELATAGGPVLIVDEESGKRRLSGRLGECLRGHYAGPETPLFYVSLAGFNLTGPIDQAALRGLVERFEAKLVIIDALVDVALGADENSVKDMMPVLHGLRQTADATGAAIMLIHHANRAGAYRGSSAIAGALDTMLEFSPCPGTQSLHELKAIKQRDGEPTSLRLTLRWDGGMFDVRRAPDAAEAPETFSKAERYVLRALANGPMTTEAIMDGADVCVSTTARKAVYSLVDRGKVKRLDAGGPGIKATYGLVSND